MRLFILSLISVSFFTLLSSFSPKEKVENKKYSTTVKLSINVCSSIKSPEKTKNIENQFYSYFSRELRSLGDVSIVSDNPDWIFKIMVLPSRNSNRIIYNIEIVSRFDIVESLLNVVEIECQISSEDFEKIRPVMKKRFSKIIRVYDGGDEKINITFGQILHEDSIENIPSLCKYIVTHFDAEYLKIERDSWQKLIDMLSKDSNK